MRKPTFPARFVVFIIVGLFLLVSWTPLLFPARAHDNLFEANHPGQNPNERQVGAPIAIEFYKSFSGAVESARGRLVIKLKTGTFQTPSTWRIVDNDPANDPEAIVDFNYQNTALSQNGSSPAAQIRFTDQVMFLPKGVPLGISGMFNISRITFDKSGTPVGVFGRSGSSEENITRVLLDGRPELIEELSFASTPEQLLLGKLIKGLPIPAFLGNDPSAPDGARSWIKSVGFESSATTPGLEIKFRDQSTINLSGAKGENGNYLTIKDTSVARLSRLVLDFETGQVDGLLRTFKLTLEKGRLSNNRIDLQFLRDANFQLQDLKFFSSPGGGSEITARNGFLSANLDTGTILTLSGDDERSANFTRFITGSGSNLLLREWSFRIGSDGAMRLTTGQNSRVTLSLMDGRIPLGENYVFTRDGTFLLDLEAGSYWENNMPPSVRGKIRFLACDVYAGLFRFPRGDYARLKGGTIRATNLTLDSASDPPVTGSLSSLVLELDNSSTLSVPSRFTAVLREGGRLNADDPRQPLTLRAGSQFFTGRVDVSLRFLKITLGEGALAAELRKGTYQGALNVLSDGRIEGKDIFFDGEASFSTDLIKQVRVTAVVEHGSYTYERISPTEFIPVAELSFKATLHPFEMIKLSAPDDCPFMDMVKVTRVGQARLTVYPINFGIALSEPVSFPWMRLRIKGNQYNHWEFLPIKGQLPPDNTILTSESAMMMEIPEKAPDQFGEDKNQQVIRMACFKGGHGSTDLFLKPQSHKIRFRIGLTTDKATGTPLIFTAANPPDIDFDFDKCDIDTLVAVALGVVLIESAKKFLHLVPIVGGAVEIATGGPIAPLLEGVALETGINIILKKLIAQYASAALLKEFEKRRPLPLP